jgi:hypothetical protein
MSHREEIEAMASKKPLTHLDPPFNGIYLYYVLEWLDGASIDADPSNSWGPFSNQATADNQAACGLLEAPLRRLVFIELNMRTGAMRSYAPTRVYRDDLLRSCDDNGAPML